MADASTADVPVGAAVGSGCQADGECSKGHCIDGVCCESTCGGCNACAYALTGKADGTCASVASGQDPHNACDDETATKECGNDGTCDGSGACRKVGANHVCAKASCSSDGKSFTPAATCDGLGACSPSTPKSCGQYQCADTGCLVTCDPKATPDACDKGTYCDPTTKVCTAQKPDGQSATQGIECTSGIVADGVCCHDACTGCNACSAALNGQAANTTGQCLPVKAGSDDPHKTCTAAPPCGLDGKCDGAGACRYTAAGTSCAADACTGSTLTKSTCDSSHTCAPTSGPCPNGLACTSASACKAGCTTNADCASGSFCSSGTCKPKTADGGTCSADGDCQNGHCVSNICCNVATCGTCNSCATGTCKPVSNGTGCGTGNFCNNGSCGACPDGSSCNPNNNPCQSGKVSCATGTAVCQNPVNVADGTANVCGSGKVCKDGACNLCADGSSCTGDVTDQCHTYAISCTTGDPVCKVSGNKPNTTPCGPAQSCSNGVEHDQASCSNGTCPSVQPTKTCPSTGCNGTSCAAACTSAQTPCGTTCCTNSSQYCSGSTCAGKSDNGFACPAGNNNACLSGNCSNSTCCASGALGCSGHCCSGSTPYCSSGGACVQCTQNSQCGSPNTCGGGGTANVCGCTPNSSACSGRTCGSASNGCGGTVSCGSCPAGQTCNASGACGCSLGAPACSGCLGWGFESGVGSWQKRADIPNAILADVAQATLHPSGGGASSLSFFVSMDPNDVNSAVILAPLCSSGSAVSVNGTSLSFEVYFDTTATNMTIGWQGNFSGGRQTGGFLGDAGTSMSGGTWHSLSVGPISGAPPLDSFQIMFISGDPWSGNVYLDNIQFR